MTGGDMEVVRTRADLRERLAARRRAGETVGLVPTMGALHDGHLSLVRRSLAYTTVTCVTLFVNPIQFGPNEDFGRYPRDEAGDIATLAAAGAHLVFAPPVAEMYPADAVSRVVVPGIGDVLEGAFRPGFFTGVATVVAKLLILTLPEIALFGEKDYQQLQVIRRMVADLDLSVKIEGARTVRESDGLAMSSRNAYLSPAERWTAPELFRTLTAVAADVAGGADPLERAAAGRAGLLAAGFRSVDYLEVCDAETLEPWPGPQRPGRVLAAARLGTTRLIDNVPLAGD
jgi:pantoate--beta-alanine ligase